ncbi:MAG TPA: 16S rRNA (uracil(1498)-N(3))-methyltransferase, partial [Bacillota bacterium]
LTAAEVAAADRCGIKPVSLGPRILRTDTAAVAALTMVLYELGDLGRRPSGRPSGGLPGMDEVE